MESGNKKLNRRMLYENNRNKIVIASVAVLAVVVIAVSIIAVTRGRNRLPDNTDSQREWNSQFNSVNNGVKTHDVLVVQDVGHEIIVTYDSEVGGLVIYEDGISIDMDVSLGILDEGGVMQLNLDSVNMSLVQNINELSTRIPGAYKAELSTSYGVLKWYLNNGYIISRKVERYDSIELYIQEVSSGSYKRLIIMENRLLIADFKGKELPDIWSYLKKE